MTGNRTPVGVWDEVREDARGLYVKGRVLTATPGGRLAGALEVRRAGRPLDRLPPAAGEERPRRRERRVSLVTFPMLPGARLRVGRGRLLRAWR